jgi:hypothetical protein
MKFDGWQIPLATIAGVMIAGAYFYYPATKSEEVAAWVQAIGSIGAILAAVWVANYQYERARRDDHEETKAFVGAVVEELKTIWQGYSADTRQRLWEVKDEGFLDLVYPVTSDAFTIYNGASVRVGKVDDPELRRLIVHVYAQAKGIVSSYQLNNEMVRAFWQSHAAMGAHDNIAIAKAKKQQANLVEYARKLKGRDKLLERDLKALFVQADKWMNAKPATFKRERAV